MRVLLLMYCSVGNHPSLRGHTQATVFLTQPHVAAGQAE